MSSLHRPRIYRLNSGSALLAAALMVFFAALTWPPLIHLISGTSMVLRDGRSPETSTVHISTAAELAMQAIGFGFFCLLSLTRVLQWCTGYVIADESGIRARNALGIVCFRAFWDQIEEIEIITRSRCGDVFVFRTKERKLVLNNYPDAGELFSLARDRSPGVRVV